MPEPPRRKPPPRRASSSRGALIAGVFLGMSIPIAGGAAYLALEHYGIEMPFGGTGNDGDDDGGNWIGVHIPTDIPEAAVEPEPPRVVYMNREGARLTAGVNDSRRNSSSLVEGAGLPHADVPAFVGTNRRWNEIVDCVRDRFSAFDVEIVDKRPIDEPFVMVMVGGRPEMLEGGAPVDGEEPPDHSHTSGLAPFNGQVVADPIVLVFARELRESARKTCETAAQEIAHAYGLDHAMHCGELMSYLRPCGRRYFRDENLDCGEHDARKCNGEISGSTQNSHQRLLEVLGPAPSEEVEEPG